MVAAVVLKSTGWVSAPARWGACLSCLFVAAVLLAGCAAMKPDIRTDYDRTVDFSSFATYGFPDELGTDRAGYSTLITTHFRQAVDREMQARSYRYTENDPNLLVNFFANVRDVTTIRSRPNVWVGYGYYGYRYGMYGAWPLYAPIMSIRCITRSAPPTSISSTQSADSLSGRAWQKAG